jgi:deoxyribonuclease-4
MILGAHESVAGGMHLAFERCARDGAHALQMWTRSSRQWRTPPLSREAVVAFRRAHAEYGTQRIPTAAHASYLINLAAPDGPIWRRSVATLLKECQRAEALGVAQVIVHPGARLSTSREEAIDRVARALRIICGRLGARARVRIALEITAGQGSCVGCSIEELAEMLDRARLRRLGICLDTQHLFAAGVPWHTAQGYEALMHELDRRIGLDRLLAFHLNDSKKPFGARVDRHAPIGRGTIGLDPFRRLVRDRRLTQVPGFLETPPLPSGEESYREGLARLRSLL